MICGRLLSLNSIQISILNFLIILDLWSINFFALLGLISCRVFLWSYYYMDTEKDFRRFLAIVVRFTLSIVVLIFMGRLFGAMIG